MRRRDLSFVGALALLLAAAVPASGANFALPHTYVVTNLVSNLPNVAEFQDPNLRNAWGITASPTSPWWVADNATQVSTLYVGAGNPLSLVVSVPGHPTGTVFNGTTDFVVTTAAGSGPAAFLFATEDGTVLGWNRNAAPTQAQLAFTALDGAIYKGLAIGSNDSGNFLYATDFHNGKIDVLNGSFGLVQLAGNFTDPGIPSGFAPFGIQNIGGKLYITYAQQDADAHDEIHGEGLGYVSRFDTNGNFLGRVASQGDLNAPWGLAWAPSDFDKFSGDLLVGNFGDGRINGFASTSGGWEATGALRGTTGHRISIDGLWGIGFGNDGNAGVHNALYFAAGPNDEADGLFGTITKP
jgi:uncharacterized protein (TIGR03118 family)